jgi:NAD(P)-dependent dehydrogenase (short-subunit alcohol dehydrogenase family)
MGELRFDDRVVIITGAGGGLGREHALLFGSRGAAVVVNDLGAEVDGSGGTVSRAESVAQEVVEAGGHALADGHSVDSPEGAESLVKATLDEFGRIDVIVNNAGILRDRAFHNLSGEDFDAVMNVHVGGSFNVTRAAWPHLREQQYGRVIFTSSAAGIFGNFGQANYAAAKAALLGLTKTLALEGAKHKIQVNAIAPIARTRMTEGLLGKLADALDPAQVSPLVAWLAHEACEESGAVLSVGGGRVARCVVALTAGWTKREGIATPEEIQDHWSSINDVDTAWVATGMADDFKALRDALRSPTP